MKMNKIGIFTNLFLATAMILSGCQASQNARPDWPPLRVEWTLWEGDYTMLVAQEKGFFEKHGVKVEPVFYDVFSKAVPDLASNKIDGGLFGLADVINATKLVKVKAVLIYDSGGTSMIIAAPEIQSVSTLKGKRIGVGAGTHGEIFVKEMLKTAGLSLNDVTLVDVEPGLISQKIPDEIQAGFTWDQYTDEAVKKGNHILFSSKDTSLASLFPNLVVFREKVVKERPEEIHAFVSAWFEALDYRLAHPEESREIISKVTGLAPKEIVVGNTQLFKLADNLQLFTPQPTPVPPSIFYSANANLSFYTTNGEISLAPDLMVLLDPSFLQ